MEHNDIGYQKYSEGRGFVKVLSQAEDTFLVTADGKFIMTEIERVPGQSSNSDFIVL